MELDAVLRERRSMRKYQPDRKVSREQVEEILKAATLAPSWKNSQTARYYVVMSDDMLKKVKETCLPAFNQTNSKDAPVLIVAACSQLTFLSGWYFLILLLSLNTASNSI